MWPIPDGTILAEGLRSRHTFGTFCAMLFSWFSRSRPASVPIGAEASPALQREVALLTERVRVLESAELVRAAEHTDVVQKLERLYKRLSMRLSRAGIIHDTPPEESPLAMRNRLGR